MTDIIYKKNFLRQVICRVDFAEFIEEKKLFTPELNSLIKKKFQHQEMNQKVKFGNLVINGDSSLLPKEVLKNNIREGIKKTYDDDVANKLIISNEEFIVDFNTYQDFDNFYSSFSDILSYIINKNKISVRRIGLRYINIFSPSELNITQGMNLFSQHISCLAQIKNVPCDDQLTLVRSMEMSEYTGENFRLNFRYGLFNKQYPAPLLSNDFVLDFDCYCDEIMSKGSEVTEQIKLEHNAINNLFEKSITDALRNELGMTI